MFSENCLSRGQTHSCDDLIALFNRLFSVRNRTLLVKGGDEPLYSPAAAPCEHHRVIFRHDYFASALHEVAHWCIAGAKRHTQIDYGYWYAPDGRTSEQQRRFEQVEAKPQALEWIFARAASYKFNISNDNLAAGEASNHAFELAVYQQVLCYCKQGLPPKAELFRLALAEFYRTNAVLDVSQFGPLPCR